jgi:hypothetical protein
VQVLQQRNNLTAKRLNADEMDKLISRMSAERLLCFQRRLHASTLPEEAVRPSSQYMFFEGAPGEAVSRGAPPKCILQYPDDQLDPLNPR